VGREMSSDKKSPMKQYEYVISSVAGILLLFQVLLLAFYFNSQLDRILLGIGWILLIPSFLLLVLPANTLGLFDISPQERAPSERKVLEKKGMYGLVRHPLYIGWMMISLSLALISQSWLSTLFSVLIIPQVLMLISLEEEKNIMKFGNEYLTYQTEVPMMNIFVGIWRKRKRNEVA
jgi:protein-S-isoprenylcysteine O-methyltransferase Ste14